MARIPTSRIGRTARVGRVAAGQAVRVWGTRAANVARSDEKAEAALEARHVEAAEQLVQVLGTMRGAAMKVGQVLSFLDLGLVPESHREEFQKKLAALRDAAPHHPFKAMRKVIEDDLGDKLGALFDDFEEEAVAAASIGQVYRAVLPDGRRVAVKVQYPGVAGAVRADMQNIGLFLRAYKRLQPGLDVRAIADEIRERVNEELDYELEAANQRAMARAHRDHPFVVVPDVVQDLCSERVIVSEWVDGLGFEEVKALDQDVKDRYAEILFRFYMGSPYRLLMFSGDPHPGNARLLEDDRVAFFDFGLFKRLSRDAAEAELAGFRAAHEGDGETLLRLFLENGLISDPEGFEPARLLEQFLDATGWFLLDETFQITPAAATQIVIDMSDPRSRHFEYMRRQNMPPEHLVQRRVEMLVLAVLGQLNATGNWHRIAREWIYGDGPVTELGQEEAAWRR